MTRTQLNELHRVAIMMGMESDGLALETYSGGRWAVVMFDLTWARAMEYARYYRSARITDRSRRVVWESAR